MANTSGPKIPGYFSGISAMMNLTRGTIDASQQDKPMDKAMSFKSTGLDLAGFAASFFKPCAKMGKALPVVGKAVNAYDMYDAKKGLDAERKKPMPDQAKINQFQRTMFINGMDLVSPPFLPVGTIVSTTVDVGTHMAKNPPVFSPQSVAFFEKYGGVISS